MIGLMRRLHARVRSGGEDAGTLAMAILVAVIGAGIAALLVPLVLVQFHATGFDDSRARELNAAEAGTDVALGLVRSATDASGVGQVSQLPCGSATGTVAGAVGGLTYHVTIGYYTENPLGQSSSWLAPYTRSGGGHGMICASGTGTYYPPTQEIVPSYVLITSTGTDSRGSRTLQSTYFVRTTNANVAGGTIYVFPAGSTNYCMDAGSARPIAGVTVQLQPCAQPVIQQQAWAYQSDLSVQLVSSVTSTYPNGLCLSASDGGPKDLDDPNGNEQSAGDDITLQPCAAVGSAPWREMWSVDDAAHLEGAKTDKSDMDGLCINVSSQGAGVALQLATCAGGVTDTKQTWVPSPDVGAGMAGASSSQVVNFQQFGRCLDVTDTDVNKGFLIAYSCKQNPDPANVLWNQKFTLNSNGEWITTTGGKNYCLTSPLQAYTGGSSGPWVSLSPCPASPTNAVIWTQYGANDSNGNPLPPLQKYTIQDHSGYCLSLTSDTSVAYNGQYSKVIVATCDGTTLQKWNAAADIQAPALKNMLELSPAQP